MGYAISEPSKMSHRRTSSSSEKSASGDFFEKPNRTHLENRSNPLKQRLENPSSPTKTVSGVHYYKYRHYKADIGRWLGRDPIEEKGAINLYGFVGNMPIGRWDKLGLSSEEVCKKCNAALAAVLPEFQKEIDWLKKKGCATPIGCDCCPYGGVWRSSGPIITGKKNVGKVELCCAGVKTKSRARVVLKHELVHALQGCTGKGGDTCGWRVCMEIQAYYSVNCAHFQGAAKKRCVKNGARYSTFSAPAFNGNGPCKTEAEFNTQFNALYTTCGKNPTTWN